MRRTFFQELFGTELSPEQIRQEGEEASDENYRQHTIALKAEERQYKKQHKEQIEYHYKKPISQVSLHELICLGFNSEHILKKHCEEVIDLVKHPEELNKILTNEGRI